MSQRQRRSSQESTASVIDVTKVEDVLEFLQKGSNLTKINAQSARFNRSFFMDKGVVLRYEGSEKVLRKAKSKVYIGDVKDILDGPSSDCFIRSFRANPDFADKSCCFSVVIGDEHKTLDLVAPDRDTKAVWVSGLRHLFQTMEGTAGDQSQRKRLYLKQIFQRADKNGDSTLDFKEVVKLLQNLNIPINLDHARKLFNEADSEANRSSSGEDCLNEAEFLRLHFLLTRREEIDQLFNKYSRGGKYMTPENLKEFFHTEQSNDLSLEECKKLILDNEMKNSNDSDQPLHMSSAGFNTMVDSAMMDIKRLKCRSVHQDMTLPLSHYFIDSSHNTYLSSNQLVGDSSVECYIRALKMGCRCVELDVWDGDNGNPVIYHGHTLTSKILLREVLEAVKQFAFAASEYPVILSIENHCNVEQQKTMARYLREIFAESLYLEPLPDDCSSLPSPQQLKGKIIVKNKKLPKESETEEDIFGSDDESSTNEKVQPNRSSITSNRKTSSGSKSKPKFSRELSDCVVICQTATFKGFDAPRCKGDVKGICSLSEKKALELGEEQGNAFVKYNIDRMCRIYPAGTRTDSSNYDPVPMWLAGCQVVALNYQTPDEPMFLNKGLFEENGRAGYVLKPSFMRKADTDFDAQVKFSPEWKRTLSLTIISGFHLPKKQGDKAKAILDPFVVVDVIGHPADRQTDKTKKIENDGFHPVWNHKMTFTVTCPHLALLLFRVYDFETGRDVVVAQYSLPFKCLQRGYRTVHLKNIYGEPLMHASLFVKVAIDGNISASSSSTSSPRISNYDTP